MRVIHDIYLVAVDQEFERSKMKSGIESINDAYFEPNQESKYRHKRQYGTVINTPATFSDKIYDMVDTGIPQYRQFIPSELIQTMVNRGRTRGLPMYMPTTWDESDQDLIRLSDIGAMHDIEIGDRVYFDYTVTDDENKVKGIFKGKKFYEVSCDKIYCAVRRVKNRVTGKFKPKIIMQGGWAFVEADMETWEDVKTKNGLMKQMRPEARLMIGYVRHIRERGDLKVGDHVVYERNADYLVRVEDKTFFAMPERDILCQIST